jgi:hypothetical protein
MEDYAPLEVGNCQICKSELVNSTTVTENELMVSAHLYVVWGEDRYHLILHIKDNYFGINHLTGKTNPFTASDKLQIYRLEGIPPITYDNVLTKLPIYLTFL